VNESGAPTMKILHVIADLAREKGGPAQACIELARLMARCGHSVSIVTTDRGLPSEYRRAVPCGDGTGTVTVDSFPGNRPRFWGTSWAMRRRLAAAIPAADVVHLHSLYLFHDWMAGAYCRRFATPYVVRPHGTLDPFMHRRHRLRKTLMELLFQNSVLRNAAGLHYTTREEQDLARPHARNARGWVVPNGIDVSAYADLPQAAALRARYPQIGNRKVVLFFGRLNFKKGVDTTIAAFAALAREREDIFLLLAGPDGGLRKAAEQWVAEAGLGNRTLFTGMVSGEDKRLVLGGSDIFVLPSQSENFGISVVEAAASGMPVIVSDRVNLWRDIEEAEAGLIAPPTPEAFTERLRFLLDNPSAAAAMGKRGVELVARRFAWDALGDRYEAMYRDAAGRGGAE
jgi:glycosyltransferase involved in cell wall biosynthesis